MTDTHIKIKPVTPRVQYTANGSTTVFPYSFAIFDDSDMVVYVDDDIITTGYTVSGAGQTDGGNVTFDTAPADGTIITLLRNVPIERMTDFQEGGTFRPKNLNDEFDRQTAFAQQVQEALTRCVKVDPTSSTNPEDVIPKVEALYDDIDNLDAIADDLANIDTVASNVSDVGTCAANMEDIQAAPGAATSAGNSAAAAAASASSAAISAAGTHFKLFQHGWFDYQLNDMAWLRADTFSWQDGTVYTDAYNHLVADYNNPEPTETLTYDNLVWARDSSKDDTANNFYAWVNQSEIVFTQEVNPTISSILYSYDEEDGYLNMGAVIESVSLQPAPRTETIGSYTITYWLATDGHKICLPDQETTVQNIYNESGVAWYYVLDTVNTRFKLPRTKYGFTGLRDTVGKYVPETLPNIKGHPRLKQNDNDGTPTGAFKRGTSNAYVGFSSGSGHFVDLDASLSSPTYQDNAPVQQRATQMYLYFYVGQYNQSATEQTAGLNSELFNGKVDLNAANLSTQGKSLISGLGMPSGRLITLTLGASGSRYTAPASGWFCLEKEATAANQYIYIGISGVAFGTIQYSTGSYQLEQIFPVKKGQEIVINYNLGGTTQGFRFVYAEGEQ